MLGVAIADRASEHAVVARTQPANEDALVLRDGAHGKVADADEDERGVDGGEVGDDVAEDGRHALRQLRVHEPHARHSGDSQARPEGQNPVHGQLVGDFVHALHSCAEVPREHDGKKAGGDDQGHPPARHHLG